jgi:hypothetical protein
MALSAAILAGGKGSFRLLLKQTRRTCCLVFGCRYLSQKYTVEIIYLDRVGLLVTNGSKSKGKKIHIYFVPVTVCPMSGLTFANITSTYEVLKARKAKSKQ